jgi:hypothetical protein
MPAATYPPHELPTSPEYVYPGDTDPLAEYLYIASAERRSVAARRARDSRRPVEDVDVVWDLLGDFA